MQNGISGKVFMLAACLYLPCSVLADEQDEGMQPLAQELFLAESPFIQAQGEFQFGVSAGRFELSKSETESEYSAELEYGVTDALTIALEIPYLFLDAHNGLGDASASLAYGLINTESFLLTLAAEFNLRTGDEDKELGEESSEWGSSVSMATHWGDAQFMAALGAELSNGDSEMQYAVALSYPLGEAVGIVELQSTTIEGDDGGIEETRRVSYITPGMLWKGRDDMEFQIGVPLGLNDDSADWGVMLKWSIEFD